MVELGTVSVPVIKQYLRYLASLNSPIDIDALLAASQISAQALSHDSDRISGEQLQDFLALLIGQVQDPLFGLKSGAFVEPGSYSVLGYISMTCATLAEALERIPTYEKLVGDMGVTSFSQTAQRLHVNWHCHYPQALVRDHLVDNVLASWLTYAHWLSGRDMAPLRVNLQRCQPGPELGEYYRQVFNCQVHFEQTSNSLELPLNYLHIALRQPDHSLRQTLEQHAASQMSALDEPHTFSVRVNDIIRILLSKGISRKDMVATQLGISERTLQRKLQQEQTSYQKLLDQARLVLAQQYLQEGQLALDDIAMQLGFSETRSFFRSFKLWTGLTPSAYRDQSVQ